MERLRDAFAKARAEQGERPAALVPYRHPAGMGTDASAATWERLETVELNDARLAAERIVTWQRADAAHAAFDVLRTRLMRLMAEKGWRKVLITSPSKGCGKTTVATNLAISLARHAGTRTLLVDLDMTSPRVAHRLGLEARTLSVADWLGSDRPPESHVLRIGQTLAVCLNTRPEQHTAELLHAERTARRLETAIGALDPGTVIYDLPPMLVSDDVIGFLPRVDCVLLVAAAGQTTAREIDACERLLDGHTNFLGVLLNKCAQPESRAYGYYDHDRDPRAGTG